MKKAFKITVLTIIYLFLCGKSCQDDQDIILRQEQEVAVEKESILSEFGTDDLSEETRCAAEINAMQKVNDLADYFKIYTDVKMDSLFRKKAAEMIRGMFVSDEVELSFGMLANRESAAPTLGDILEKGYWDKVLSADLVFNSLMVLEPLQRSGAESYHGKLIGFQKLTCNLMTDTLVSAKEKIAIDIIALHGEKTFGRDTISVWTVFLGDISKRD